MRLPLLTALLVLVVFTVASLFMHRGEVALVDAEMSQAADRIHARIDAQISLLYSVRGLFMNSDEVTRKELQGFLRAAEVNQRAPGMQGVGFAIAAPAEPDGDVESLLRDRYGLARAPWPETDQSKRFPIVFLEPNDERNRAALAYDMYSNDVRREAMDTAIRTGEPAVTKKVTLVQEIDEDVQSGFLIYLPLISTADGPMEAGGNRSSVEGFVYAPFRARDLMEAVLDEAEMETFGLSVYLEEEAAETLLFTNNDDPRSGYRQTINVAQMDWVLRIEPKGGWQNNLFAPSRLTIFFGLLVSALSTLMVRSQQSRVRTAVALSAERLARADDRDLMLREMSHRMKNAIARIQSIAQLSANNTETIDEYVNKFVGRLQAMANAQDLLTQAQWKSKGLQALLETEIGQIADTESDQVSLSGPTVQLNGLQAQAMGLVVHELATNASKYGAFKQGGAIDVSWSITEVDGAAHFNLKWLETGLSHAPDLSRTGFGTDLSSMLISDKLSGTFTREADGNDLVINIDFPYALETALLNESI